MSVQTDHKVRVLNEIDRPWRGVSAGRLADILEAQYDKGEPFNEGVVFEILGRCLEAEGLVLPVEPYDGQAT